MYSWVRAEHLVQWTKGRLVGTPLKDFPVQIISTDSRTIKKSEVFAALRGESFDGHEFVVEVAKKGASLIISEKEFDCPAPLLIVPDTLRALISIARELRNHFKGPVFGITGSAGKSSTKEALATILGDNTLASPASFNNLLGVSKTLFLITDDVKQVVLEMGMNDFGEIKEISETFRPTGGLITNIGDAHIGRLGGKEGIYRAKKELFDYLASTGAPLGVALNLDDVMIGQAFRECFHGSVKVVTYTTKSNVMGDVRTLLCEMDPESGNLRLEVSIKGHEVALDLPIYGLHFAQNIAAAIAAGVLYGVEPKTIGERLKGFRPASHRGHIHHLSEKRILIDECYNSNPSALRASLRSCAQFNPQRQRLFVLGEMRELEGFSRKLHEEAADYFISTFEKIPFSLVAVTGDMKWFMDRVKAKFPGNSHLHFVSNAEEATALARSLFTPGTISLIKGSRGVKLDRVVADLTKI